MGVKGIAEVLCGAWKKKLRGKKENGPQGCGGLRQWAGTRHQPGKQAWSAAVVARAWVARTALRWHGTSPRRLAWSLPAQQLRVVAALAQHARCGRAPQVVVLRRLTSAACTVTAPLAHRCNTPCSGAGTSPAQHTLGDVLGQQAVVIRLELGGDLRVMGKAVGRRRGGQAAGR